MKPFTVWCEHFHLIKWIQNNLQIDRFSIWISIHEQNHQSEQIKASRQGCRKCNWRASIKDIQQKYALCNFWVRKLWGHCNDHKKGDYNAYWVHEHFDFSSQQRYFVKMYFTSYWYRIVIATTSTRSFMVRYSQSCASSANSNCPENKRLIEPKYNPKFESIYQPLDIFVQTFIIDHFDLQNHFFFYSMDGI